MQIKNVFLVMIMLLQIIGAYAQDLIRKVPKDANVVVTLNNKALLAHVGINELNATFSRLGFFNKFNKEAETAIHKVEDMGLDLDAKAYLFVRGSDSIQYFGALLPLANKKQFELFLPKNKVVQFVNGLPTLYSCDKTLRLSWDDKTVYVLAGTTMANYFDREDVRLRYNLQQTYDSAADDAVAAASDWEAYDFDADTVVTPDTTEAEEWSYDADEDYIYHDDDDDDDAYAVVDSVLALDQYADDYYSRYDSITKHNDSIKNKLAESWINQEMALLIAGKIPTLSNADVPPLSKNTLAHVFAKDLSAYFSYFYPADIFKAALGLRPTFNYGIDGIDGSIVVDGNTLKFVGAATFDKEMGSLYKDIYNKKINPKFLPFLEKESLGFLTFNLNTEAYIKNMPKIIEHVYASSEPRYKEIFSLASTMLDVMLDEKAIAKVFKGDNLLVLNGVSAVDVTYTDYEYDDSYNYTEVEKTRQETIPQFLWMFSSDDTRIFQQLIQIGIRENKVEDEQGIYKIKESTRAGVQLYILMKNGIVFVGNDSNKLKAIQGNRFHGKAYGPYAKLAKKNAFAAVFNTGKVPDLMKDLNIPVEKSMEETVQELAEYGDVYMTSSGVKNNRLTGEFGITFPNKKGNALAFLLDVIDRWSMNVNN